MRGVGDIQFIVFVNTTFLPISTLHLITYMMITAFQSRVELRLIKGPKLVLYILYMCCSLIGHPITYIN